MIVVGLTGGIASGKSFVSEYLKKLKIPVHESDNVIRSLYKKPKKNFLNYLKKNGFEKAVSRKIINKNLIRDEFFKNKNKKNKLEIFLHKEVEKDRVVFLNKYKKKEIVFLDIPLLFEKKLEKSCAFICTTIAPLKKRKKRALNRKFMSKKILNQIIKNQVKDTYRKKRSDYLIDTSKTTRKTCLQIDNIIYDILIKKIKK